MKSRLATSVGLTLAAFLAAGCQGPVVSLKPLFFERDIIIDPSIEGTWAPFPPPTNTTQTWTFQKASDKGYDLTITSGESPLKLEAYMFRLDRYLFFDLKGKSDSSGLTIPVHMFFRAWKDKDGLLLAQMDAAWFSTMAGRGKTVPYTRVDSTIVLTASTEELQRFVLMHIDDPTAFDRSTPGILVRSER